jgi:hypothetical protein
VVAFPTAKMEAIPIRFALYPRSRIGRHQSPRYQAVVFSMPVSKLLPRAPAKLRFDLRGVDGRHDAAHCAEPWEEALDIVFGQLPR